MKPATGVTRAAWDSLSGYVAAHLGLDFPPRRRQDLKRGAAAAMRELGFADPVEGIGRVLARPGDATVLQALANHLTNGETYFFRDQPALNAFATQVLQPLIAERRGKHQYLRLWCAACSTGEEAYTLAIIIHQLLPDLAQWQVSILATDAVSYTHLTLPTKRIV